MSARQRRNDQTMGARMRDGAVVCGLVALLLVAGACKEQTPCDEGQVLRDSYCWYVDAAAASDTLPTASGGEVGAGEAGPSGEVGPPGEAAVFGRSCAGDGDCAAPATLCAPQLNYCTAIACDVSPGLCPAGWICMDVSAYAGRPETMCFRPF